MSETITTSPTTDPTLPPTTTTEPDPTTTTEPPPTTTDPPTTPPPTTTPPTTTPPTTSEEETETSETETETETETSETETTSETTSAPTSTPTTESTTSASTVETSSRLLTSISTNDGVTETVVVVTDPGTGPTQSAISDDSSDGNSSFFDNKGAVAGVFTVVGLAALVLIIVVATNAIRRRRAKKFDDEVAAAAAEANASTRYPFDDYDDPTPGRGGGGYGSYSDPESHGTLSQVPLTHHGESYNMSEFNGGYGPSYGASATAVGAGAAGIGTLARRNTNTYGDVGAGTPGVPGYGAPQTSAHPVTPYNAFAGPISTMPTDPYDPYTAGNLGIKRQPSRGTADLLDAAGIGAAGIGSAAVGASAVGGLNRGPSQSTAEQAALDRQRSLGTERTLSPDNSNHSGSKTQESYAAHYQPDFRPNEHQYQPAGTSASGGQPSGSSGEALPNPFARDETDEDAYGADSFTPAGRHSPTQDDGRMSIRDEEDYGRAGRTLKVANE